MPQVQNCKDCKTVLTLEQQELPSAGIRTDGTIFGATFTNIQLGRWQMTFNQPNSHGSGSVSYTHLTLPTISSV